MSTQTATEISTKFPSYAVRCRRLVKSVETYYSAHRRRLPWRDELSAERNQRFYQVLVSEMMLQQTQVSRVTEKYQYWMGHFPRLEDCASASLAEILQAWQGLGYNRRAKYLHSITRHIASQGIPESLLELQNLPGIGPNTAAAIAAYCDEAPVEFVETNIRSVVLEHVYADSTHIDDRKIIQVLSDCRPSLGVRDWYWALMDYGSYLKAQKKGHLSRTLAYRKQASFQGSKRQLRRAIIRYLTVTTSTSRDELADELKDERLDETLRELEQEGMVSISGSKIRLPSS